MVLITYVGQYFTLINPYTSVGAKGVFLFFALSGYLILKSLDNSNNLKEYFKKRIVSIVPTYYVILIILYVKELVFLGHNMSIADVISGPCNYKFLRYFSFLHMILPSDDWALWNNRSALWTISSFAVFYLIAPLLYKWIKTYKQSFIMLFIFLLVTPYISQTIQYYFVNYPSESHIEWFAKMNPLSEFYCFIFGVTLFYAMKEGKEIIYAVLLGAILILTQIQWFSYEIIFTILLMLVLKSPSIIKSDKIISIIQFLSKGSFALYLCHPILLQIAVSLGNKIYLNDFTKCLFFLIVTIGGSYTLWWFVLRPIENMVKGKLDKESYVI